MIPKLRHCSSIATQVDKSTIISRSPQTGRRQLVLIIDGSVSDQLRNHVLLGGVDNQTTEPNDTCRLSARYTLRVAEGTIYVENNGIRRVSAQYHDQLFTDDIRFFSDTPPGAIYFYIAPSFGVDTPALSWLTTSLFICTGGRTQDGVVLDFCQVD